jgi:hypothetical protein
MDRPLAIAAITAVLPLTFYFFLRMAIGVGEAL